MPLAGKTFKGGLLRFGLCLALVAFLFPFVIRAQNPYENKIIRRIDITFEGADRDVSAAEQFRALANSALGEDYSTVRVRDAIERLYETDRIVSVSVQADLVGENEVDLRFMIQRKSIAKKITVNVSPAIGDPVTEQEIRLQINLLTPGTAVSDKILRENSNLILTYLRDRGYFDADVDASEHMLANEKEIEVVFDVKPKAQARINSFETDITGADKINLQEGLSLSKGSVFSRDKLLTDVDEIRSKLQDAGYLAPRLLEPRVVYDSDENTIDVSLKGVVGAEIAVSVEAEGIDVGSKTQTRLLPVKREGTLDYSAIVEGQRRLETYFQEKGYFFATVEPLCSVTPAFAPDEASATENETQDLCAALSGAELLDRKVELKYEADLNRRLRLADLRLEGTDLFTIEDISAVLQSTPANSLGFIPFIGYGRGYTSIELIQQDKATILSLLRELGYREAKVGVKQGVSPAGEDLIITFVVRTGRPTKISEVSVEGNTSVSAATLRAQLPLLEGKTFSRTRARNGAKTLGQYYANQGFYFANVTYSTVELPDQEGAEEDEVKLVFKVEDEGKPVYVNRILINGNEITKTDAIRRSLDVESDKVLRQTDIYSSEQRLFSTDAFENVEFFPEPAGEKPDGSGLLSDVIVNLEEKKPRLITYGGGYSTDVGLSGFFDIRNFNLFGKLQQGGAQIRWSQRQQLVQLDFVDPRFWRDGTDQNGAKRFAPLRFSAQYQRDSTVTRFFRSAFDRGTFGIVQRIDENGVPIDEFGNSAGDPTLNRFTISAETNRTISQKDRSILFFKYRFEDVRLFNFESLLIKELLRPDAKIRISGMSATFVRDTRKACSIVYTFLEKINQVDSEGTPCKYSASDPTGGDYLTAEFDFSAPVLGANVGFSKFQIAYNRYYTFKFLRNTTIAARGILGAAHVFSGGDRFTNTQFPGLNGSLPISERFFGGGSTNLRGFDFEEAGPRVVVVPQGTFRNQQGEIVTLDPFTIPFGGNALAVTNIEARIPVFEGLRAVPFYDGGNVFNRYKEIFNPANASPNDVFETNKRAVWTHTVGFGLRIKTPIGGEFAIDYGYLLNPPKFLIPQQNGPNGIYQLRQGQFHFRFSQAF
ncbi:MAG: POTRA domain-containing protein [Pyrinomonadaceae bacterium]